MVRRIVKAKSGSVVIQKRSFYFNARERIFISIVTRDISGLLAHITTLVFLTVPGVFAE